jgi:ABC-type transport system substrate-binding protein
MKKIMVLIAIAAMLAMMIPLFAPAAHAAGQPPIITNTLWEGTIAWGPADADPGIAYDTASGQLLQHAYQGLLAWKGEQYYDFVPVLSTNIPTLQAVTMTVTNTSVVGTSPVGSTWTDGTSTFTIVAWTDELANGFSTTDVISMTDGTTWRTWQVDGKSGTSTITLNLWRGFYVFNLRTSPTVYFYDHNGNHAGIFGADDAVYTLERYMVVSDLQNYSPMWMLDKPLFDVPDHTVFTNSTAMNLAHLIKDAFVGDSIAHTLTINIGDHFPDNAFKQILSNTWGSMMSKNNTIALGDWDGDLFKTTKYGGPFPDWWLDWAAEGVGRIGDYESGGVPANSLTLSGDTYFGTGPFHISSVDSVNNKVIMERNPDFWMGWPSTDFGFVSNGTIDTVEIDYISDWNARKSAFLSGSIDICAVPRAYMFQLLDNITKQPSTPGIKTITSINPTLTIDVYEFGFLLVNGTTHVGTGVIPDGIPLDFFNNTHTRRAFSFGFDHVAFDSQVFFGESTYRKNVFAIGLYPDYYNDSVPGFTQSLANAEAELKLAIYGGQSLWTTGFTMDLAYNSGNDIRKIACTMMASFFTTLSTFDGRTGHAFTINVVEELWPTFLAEQRAHKLPMYDVGWLADFADADDFVRPYMYSTGNYAGGQRYTAINGWGSLKDTLIDQAVLTPDGPARQAIYQQLQLIYYNDCPSLPINNPTGRQWQWYWVKGNYWDALYPARYYRSYWKQDNPWYDISGSPPAGTVGISDGVVNMKDIAYLIAHFNAQAPVPGLPVDPKWQGFYGANGGVDPFGDRKSNMKDIAGVILSFNAHGGTGHP